MVDGKIFMKKEEKIINVAVLVYADDFFIPEKMKI